MHRTLIDVPTLERHLGSKDWAVFDCRFDLTRTGAGRQAYLEAHIPTAVYVDLERDLSGPPVTDRGRHPMPTAACMVDLFTRLGISPGTQVVAYDESGGCFAARLWWMLQFMGHGAAAVLDGGWSAWQAPGLPVRGGEEQREAAPFRGEPHGDRLVTADQVAAQPLLIDSREPARYRGEVEPLDPVAGHIPGARNYFWRLNLGEGGRFLPPAEIRFRLTSLMSPTPPKETVFYCGSGVTACHNLLAAVHAGLEAPKLYAGSWSDWCSDPGRPVATGDEG